MDLTTDYLGLRLRNPLVASASPLSGSVTGVQRLADAGIGAVVLPSLFEEQLRWEADRDARLAAAGTDAFAEALDYLPAGPDDAAGSRQYLSLLSRAVAAVDVPVIASLNGITAADWADHATAMQDAGAAAIELNIYHLPGDPYLTGHELEQRHIDILAKVRSVVRIPVAAKIGPYFSSIGEITRRLDEAGADGLVLFNRFMQPDIDPDTLAVTAGVRLSTRAEARMPRSWIALLRGQVTASLAATTGVEDAGDVAAYLLAGADVVMTASALLRHGPEHAGSLLDGLIAWMDRKGFTTVNEVRGLLSIPRTADGLAYGRSSYLTAMRQAASRWGPVTAEPGEYRPGTP